MDTFFKFATPIVYWILIIVWASISIFYFKKIKLLYGYGKFLKLLLIILAIDATRSFLESLYFGAWYTSYSGLLPIGLYNFLANPKIVFIPKIINLIIAILILFLIIKKWLEYELIEINETFDKQGFEIKKLSAAVNQSANSIIITDVKGNIEYTNPKFTKITGYTAEEVLGKNPRILNSGEQSIEFYSNMWKIISTGEIWNGEFKNKKKNGEFYWEDVTMSPIKNDAGEIVNYLAIKKDISELKENEIILKEKNSELSQLSDKLTEKNRQLFDSENKFKKLFSKSPVSIIEQDFSEAIKLLNKKKAETSDIETYLNENLAFVKKCVSKIEVKNVNEITLSLLGVKNLEALKSHFIKSNTEKSYNSLKNELVSIALGKKDFYGETEFVKFDGTILHAMIKSTMIDDNGGNIASIVDITENTKAQEELILAKENTEANNANVTAIIEGTNDSIWAFDKNYDILYINQVFQREFQNTFGVLLEQGVNLIEALPQELRDFWRPRYDKVLNNEQFIVEDAVDTEDGMIYILVKFNPIIKNSQVVGGSCMGSNISQQKLSEMELIIAKEKAEESEALKSAFLANMSHEIRTPMNSILGFSELLMNEELTPEKKEHYHEIVNNSGKRLMNLISDIVDISRIDAKQLTINYSVFNLNILLDNLQSQFEISPLCKNVTYKTSKGLTDDISFIKTDNNRLVQILSNLIENALKFTDNGIIEIGYTTNDSELQFFIKDSGVGINKKDLSLIFERFGQSDNQYQKAKEGTGLGLSISKGIIEMLDGKIWVESEPHRGTTFFFTIPNCMVENIELNEVKNSTVKIVPKITPTILIAEDDESNYWLVEAILEKYDFKLLHAENGKEAVEMFQNNEVDLILMDFNMPIMSGTEATEVIRQTNKEIPIIALTAYAMAEDKERATKVGCNDFLSKPVNHNVLLETINHNLKATIKV